MKFQSVMRWTLVIALGIGFTLPGFAHRKHYRHTHRGAKVRINIRVGQPRRLARPVVVRGKPAGAIDFHVQPKDTEVHVDGTYRGTVDQFDGHPDKLILARGTHRITLKTPDGDEWSEKVKIRAGYEIELKVELDE